MAQHKYTSRLQAELEAQDYSEEHDCVVMVYKLPDGRYENTTVEDRERGGSAMAKYANGRQVF
jgi:hypothetical protein